MTALTLLLSPPKRRLLPVVLGGAALAVAAALIAQVSGDRGIAPVAATTDISVGNIDVNVVVGEGMAADGQKCRLKNEPKPDRKKTKPARLKSLRAQRTGCPHDCSEKTKRRDDEQISIHWRRQAKIVARCWQSSVCGDAAANRWNCPPR